MRAAVTPALEKVALWHERDISHSSVERVFGPDATITLDFALQRLAGVVEALVVYPESMQANLDQLGGLVHSQQLLLALTQQGVSREDAYSMVQRNAMESWKTGASYRDLLKADADVMPPGMWTLLLRWCPLSDVGPGPCTDAISIFLLLAPVHGPGWRLRATVTSLQAASCTPTRTASCPCPVRPSLTLKPRKHKPGKERTVS